MRRSLVVGVLVLLVGLAGIAAPEVTGWVPAADAVPLLLAAGAFVAGGVAVRDRLGDDGERFVPPEPERYPETPTPGTDFDDLLADVVPYRSRADDRRQERVTERLESVALAVFATEGYTEEAAREMLADGSWTDDPEAAAFFAETGRDAAAEGRLRDLFESTPPFVRRARRAVAALDARTPTEDRSGEDA